MLENNTLRTIWLGVGTLTRLFRVQSGRGWTGNKVSRHKDGSITIHDPRPLTAGFSGPDNKPFAGVADLVGPTPIVITPEMVGNTVAVFTMLEIKREDGTGRNRESQLSVQEGVRALGGIYEIVKSVDEATTAILEFRGVRR